MVSPRSTPPRRRQGFTLLELLVAFSIIAILAALLFSVMKRSAEMRDRAAMSAQLRTLTSTTFSYANDNSGTLPGPLLSSLNFRYKKSHPEFLMTNLVPYTSYPAPGSSWDNTTTLMTPKQRVFRESLADDKAHFYCITVEGEVQPFGWYNGSTLPMRLSALPDPSDVVMYMEGDQKAPWLGKTKATIYARSTFPKDPLHGSTRYFSYFDGSIQVAKDIR
jgi:prepilin-type N-terminal cleavage/methylation domain-containing protein